MLRTDTLNACATAGTAVFKIVVSSCSNKNATATSHGSNFLQVGDGERDLDIGAAASIRLAEPMKSQYICTPDDRSSIQMGPPISDARF